MHAFIFNISIQKTCIPKYAVMGKATELIADLLAAGIAGVLMSEQINHEETLIVILVFLCALIS